MGGFQAPGIVVRDHFRKTPENLGGPRYGLGPLRVLADTTIAGHSGFPMHAHQEMEIITFVCEGVLTHVDTLGYRGQLHAGDVQVMTCGTGLQHTEFNEYDAQVRVYQLWIEPALGGLTPTYLDLKDPRRGETGRLHVLASGAPAHPGGVLIHQDAAVFGAALSRGQSVSHRIGPDRHIYVIVACGRVSLNGTDLGPRDGAVVDGVDELNVDAVADSDVLLLDLPR